MILCSFVGLCIRASVEYFRFFFFVLLMVSRMSVFVVSSFFVGYIRVFFFWSYLGRLLEVGLAKFSWFFFVLLLCQFRQEVLYFSSVFFWCMKENPGCPFPGSIRKKVWVLC